MLSTTNHDRDVLDLTYVYPVVSRRAGGVSLGINLNPNNACNWQCVYCQVPNLSRGVAPAADLGLLKQELRTFLHTLLEGDYMQQHVPEGCRVLQDVAISGNGEPTTCPNFADVVALLRDVMQEFALDVPLRLISNGSSVHKADVQRGLACMGAPQAKPRGEVWFKVDAIGEKATQRLNGVSLSATWQREQLQHTAALCPTWLQTCVLDMQDKDEQAQEMTAYIDWLRQTLAQGVPVQGVLLYGLARPSLQAGGDTLKTVDADALQAFAQRIAALGLPVQVS